MDISDFTKTHDYLPLLNGALMTDLIIICIVLGGRHLQSHALRQWYNRYHLGAVIADVLIIVIGIIIARYLYPRIFKSYSLWRFIGLAVAVQVVHDLIFYQVTTSIPRGRSGIMDVFYDYGREVSYKAVIADSAMMVTTCLLFALFADQSLNTNIILFIGLVYLTPYLIFSLPA
jgi:hypothetical protein